MALSKRKLWMIWGAASLALIGLFAWGISSEGAATDPVRSQVRIWLLPGKTTSGHHQIELACEACHTNPFGGREVLQEACVNCHGAELKHVDDSHPISKFTDPRNADRVEKLDATQCVTCHVEHKPGITGEAGFTLPKDTCRICHADITEDRPTHKGLGFETCASSGCHNYHDNRALYEDYLIKHVGQSPLLETRNVPPRNFREKLPELGSYPHDRYPQQPLTLASADAGKNLAVDGKVMQDWLSTSHAQSGVNCSGCHQQEDQWIKRPTHEVCASCHGDEVKGFTEGKHGMRLAQKLSPMRPEMARIPMRSDAHGKDLTCTTCHGAHRFDTRKAAAEVCLTCHADEHSLAYKSSPHFALWQKELKGEAPAGSGVSCATCHMPRVDHQTLDYVSRTLVEHNQNASLRPNEKMIRAACQSCHGLGFSIDALADPKLIRSNFKGQPSLHVKSLELAQQNEAIARAKRAGQVSE